MEKLNQKQKIASLIKAEVALSKDVRIVDAPGEFCVSLYDKADDSYFEDLRSSSIELTDVCESDKPYYSQKGNILISGLAIDEVKRYEGKDVILRFTRSDGGSIIVGNNEFPVRLLIEQSGRPVTTKLTFDHKHPEHSKELI